MKQSKGVLQGDKTLSNVQDQSVIFSFPLLEVWQEMLPGEEDKSINKVNATL